MKKEVELRLTLHAIELSGNTYPYKEKLKEIGFTWDPTFRCWKLRFPFKPSQASLDIPRDDENLDKFLEEYAKELKKLGFKFVDKYMVYQYFAYYVIAEAVIQELRKRNVPVTIA